MEEAVEFHNAGLITRRGNELPISFLINNE